MSLINFTSVQDGTTAVASQVNAPLTTIYNEFNGNITAANLAANSVTTAKLADASVTSTKIDFGGAGAGIWWEEIGRTTLGVAGDTISVTGITAKKYLKIIVSVTATGGTVATQLRFNNDSGNNYAYRQSVSGGADGTTASTNYFNTSGVLAVPHLLIADVLNIATQEKIGYLQYVNAAGAGASSIPVRIDGASKWTNASDSISRVDVLNVGAGDYAIGSEVIVLGHN